MRFITATQAYLSLLLASYIAAESCYDSKTKAPKKCIPSFVNVAYGLSTINVTNTCGLNGRTEYCVQSSNTNYKNKDENGKEREEETDNGKKCSYCDARDPKRRHSVEYLTDFESQGTVTWWQSETMYENIQHPNSVNITFDFQRPYELTYVKISFQSSRPESFAIYKRTYPNSAWTPYQYYSASCEETYGVAPSDYVQKGHEDVAMCNGDNSDIAPLSGESVGFSTLENRPSSYNFDTSQQLNEWVTASAIKIVLNRLNTFSDEIFNDRQALQTYFYAISDISIGGRCKCNGHAADCVKDSQGVPQCVCEHNTAGKDCERCLPLYNSVQWRASTKIDPFECVKCDCNDLADECVYDPVLFKETNDGGRCINCRANRDGPHCEYCKEGFYRLENDIACTDCACDPIGSESKQCDPSGKCKCRPGVTGDKCDRCAPNHYGLTLEGCKVCTCNVNGSIDSPPSCSPVDGTCRCKANVEGRECDACKPGYFNLDARNLHGCQKCFCHGHSSDCTSADNYKVALVTSSELNLNKIDVIKVSTVQKESHAPYDQSDDTVIVPFDSEFSNGNVWLLAPQEYLGNKLVAYNQELSFEMRLGGDQKALATRRDIILENSNEKMSVFIWISAGENANQLPNNEFQRFAFRLSENAAWSPSLKSHQFQRLLSNLTAIKIRANFINSETYIKNLTLASAAPIDTDDEADSFEVAKFVEKCTCPTGYMGQFCHICAYGYKRENPADTLFSKCVPCTCNNHSLSCDRNTGECTCQHDTTGHNCDKCQHGFYGNALKGTPDDCKKCECPNGGACIELYNFIEQKNDVVCTECPEGTEGNQCEFCSDGFFSQDARMSACEPCQCNENIDLNAIGNCDRNSGKCLRCVFNTTGDKCEKCLPGYWGNALTELKCHACECYALGTKESPLLKANFDDLQCDLNTGNCDCKENVVGRQCNECRDGFWNITSGEGCADCQCNVLGSFNASCNVVTGQCFCRPGVTGLKCDRCLVNYFDFDEDGCKPCDCDPFGSASLQCDAAGKCACKENISGYKCNRCDENKYNYTSGCLSCPDCYNLVQKKTNSLKDKMKYLQTALNSIFAANNESKPEDSEANKELENQLSYVRELVGELHVEVFNKSNFNKNYQATIEAFYENFNLTRIRLREIEVLFNHFTVNFTTAQNLNKHNSDILKKIAQHLSVFKDLLDKYSQNISEHHGNLNSSENNKKMQELAQQARESSKRYKALVEEVIREVEKNVNQTNYLLQMFNNIKANFAEMDAFIKNLQLNVGDQANNLVEKAKEAKNMLLSRMESFKEAIQNVSNYDTQSEQEIFDSFTADSSLLKDSLAETKIKIDEFNAKFSDFSKSDAGLKIEDANRRLDAVKVKQAELQALNDTSSSDYDKAIGAQNLAAEILKNASSTLEVLKNFDESIENSKKNAEDAANLSPDIEKNIEEALEYSKKIKQTLPKIYVQPINDRDISLEKLNKEYSSLNENSHDLVKKSEEVVTKFKDLPSASKLKEVNNTLFSNFTELEDQAERLVVNSTELLGKIMNNLEALDQTDKNINEFLQQNLSLDDVNKLIEKFAKVSAELSKKSEAFNLEIGELEKNNKIVLQHIDSMRIQASVLSEQVQKLDLLNKTLTENSAWCPYSVGQTNELL